ncbi:hypothetical protein QE177_01985 [Arsenophonus sp. aPb]|uniref:DUF6931 family protein n=1 Tax=Arsenophonus sp. aPb TaxID=3041619 RepID=UPI00246977A0|nr:hypothetical protein [Arsenophonus sp. aPb]WGL98702.1 hypothetical protein QE177_01985 [Arsenophonus sp. aPb]
MVKLKHCQLSPVAEQILQPFASHNQNLQALREDAAWTDMVFYTVFMLPYRQALDLALAFIGHVYERELVQEQRILLQHARDWRSRGGDQLRHQLFEQAEAIGFDNPIAGLVLSIFLSEGSVTAPDLDAVTASPWQATQALASVLCLILHFYSHDNVLQDKYVEQFFMLAQRYLIQLTPDTDLGRKNYFYQETTT